jgi:hypothetical protein
MTIVSPAPGEPERAPIVEFTGKPGDLAFRFPG